MEEIENDLREMFGVIKPIALNRPVTSTGKGSYYLPDQLKAGEVCAELAMAIAEIREQRREEEAE